MTMVKLPVTKMGANDDACAPKSALDREQAEVVEVEKQFALKRCRRRAAPISFTAGYRDQGKRGHSRARAPRASRQSSCPTADVRRGLSEPGLHGQMGSAISRVQSSPEVRRPTAIECPLTWSGCSRARCRQCLDTVGNSPEALLPHSESVPSNQVWPFPCALPTAQCCGPAPEPAQPQQLTMSHAAATRGVVTRIPTLLSKASQPFVTNEAWA